MPGSLLKVWLNFQIDALLKNVYVMANIEKKWDHAVFFLLLNC